MNYKTTIQKMGTPLVMAAALTFVASTSFARVDLVAIEGTWSPDGGTTLITMWGFETDVAQPCGSLPTWTVGPELTAADLQGNGQLRVRLRNCLSEPVSIVIPGQQAIDAGDPTANPQPQRSAGRITSFTRSTPIGGTRNYFWEGVNSNEGTYLYMSGSHPAKQVHMGLYGSLKVGTYPGTSGDVTLLYSEIDASLHSPPTAATPLTYKPDHYLVNGKIADSIPNAIAPDAIVAGQTIVLSFLNAGLDFHVPAINGGGYMTLEAEDGNPYPFPKTQYSVNLAAGKTIEAFWPAPAAGGDYVIYDRRGNGMNATLTVTPPTP